MSINYDITTPFPGKNIYLILVGTSYKIGISKDPIRRLSNLQTGNPKRLELIWCCPGDKKFENKFHRKYKPNREIGEWFELTQEEVDEIIRSMAMKSMNMLTEDATKIITNITRKKQTTPIIAPTTNPPITHATIPTIATRNFFLNDENTLRTLHGPHVRIQNNIDIINPNHSKQEFYIQLHT